MPTDTPAKILAVDDDPTILVTVAAALESGGYHPVTTTNPLEAVELALKGSIDAAVLDINMPAKSGLEIIRELRADERSQSLPILVLSSLNDAKDRIRGLEQGADDYVTKPFDPEELVMRIRRLLAPRSGRSGLLGNLQSFRIGALLQSLVNDERTGVLQLEGAHGKAHVGFVAGLLVSAKAGSLKGVEALLDVLENETGVFSFVERDREAVEANADTPLPPLQMLLLDAAWLADELKRRQDDLPGAWARLWATDVAVPAVGQDYDGLPLDEVMEAVRRQPGGTLTEIPEAVGASRLRVRLAVALLHGAGALEVQEDTPEPLLKADDTGEEETFEEALRRLLAHYGHPGLAHFHVAAEESCWEQLLELLARLPATALRDPRDDLLAHLTFRRQGTVALQVKGSHVFLSLHVLSEGQRLKLAGYMAAVLWLRNAENFAGDLANAFAQHPETLPPVTLLVSENVKPETASRLEQVKPCRVVQEMPQSMADILGHLVG